MTNMKKQFFKLLFEQHCKEEIEKNYCDGYCKDCHKGVAYNLIFDEYPNKFTQSD